MTRKKPKKRVSVDSVKHKDESGRWAFIEIVDPWDAKNTIRESIHR